MKESGSWHLWGPNFYSSKPVYRVELTEPKPRRIEKSDLRNFSARLERILSRPASRKQSGWRSFDGGDIAQLIRNGRQPKFSVIAALSGELMRAATGSRPRFWFLPGTDSMKWYVAFEADLPALARQAYLESRRFYRQAIDSRINASQMNSLWKASLEAARDWPTSADRLAQSLIKQCADQEIPLRPISFPGYWAIGHGVHQRHVCLSLGLSGADELMEPGQISPPPRIPIVAVTGTTGKSTCTRMIAAALRGSRLTVAEATNAGVRVGDLKLYNSTSVGAMGAWMALGHPLTQIGILEVTQNSTWRTGIGYLNAHITLVVNVREDHIGSKFSPDLKTYQENKKFIAMQTPPGGLLVLNADDPVCRRLGNDLSDRKIIWFGKSIHSHERKASPLKLADGCVSVSEGNIVILHEGRWKEIARLDDFASYMHGVLEFNSDNLMAAIAVSGALPLPDWGLNEKVDQLKQFAPNADASMGQFNLIPINGRTIVLDRAHNLEQIEAALESCRRLMKRQGTQDLAAIVSSAGDHPDEWFNRIGTIAAKHCRHAWFYCPPKSFLRGRKMLEIPKLIEAGYKKAGTSEHRSVICASEQDAVLSALSSSPKGALIYLSIKELATLRWIEERRAAEQNSAPHEEDQTPSLRAPN